MYCLYRYVAFMFSSTILEFTQWAMFEFIYMVLWLSLYKKRIFHCTVLHKTSFYGQFDSACLFMYGMVLLAIGWQGEVVTRYSHPFGCWHLAIINAVFHYFGHLPTSITLDWLLLSVIKTLICFAPEYEPAPKAC